MEDFVNSKSIVQNFLEMLAKVIWNPWECPKNLFLDLKYSYLSTCIVKLHKNLSLIFIKVNS